MSVGAIGERKGHLLTLKAFERVRDLGIDCKLIIVGTISSQSYYEKLKTAVGQSNYCEAIEIRLDVPANELMQVFETSHVFVLHSEEESQGIAIVEAMATGMPVVATKVGGIPFVVSDGVAGFLAEYGDVVGFADSIIKLLTNFQLWQDFSDASVFFANAFHWKNINNKVKALYGSDN
jgi:glycosyltransferase involved in cell wall biosynthesis